MRLRSYRRRRSAFRCAGLKYELLTLPLPFVLWYVVFQAPPLGFWPTLGVAASLLLLASLPRVRGMGFRVSPRGLLLAVGSAVGLYLFFWSGYQVARTIPGFVETIASVYSHRGDVSLSEVSLLLLFPVGPAEELYWRGLIQKRVQQSVGSAKGILLTTVLYSAIHLPTLNPSLLAVAFVGGLAWGALYSRTRSLIPAIVSHTLFDEMIFVLFVIG